MYLKDDILLNKMNFKKKVDKSSNAGVISQ